MHITEIVLDGFKSYAKRTVISGFDPEFNAITGLNGTGKSNILDSICFVLGISNLTQVRAANLNDLIYKQGQAGVTKASVTLVFDNSNASMSPLGYEQLSVITVTRQIAIGGRNKYLINGHNAQLQRVQNLFHSVQLNVNNPHFLIMQGRITKVLNMKPIETLGMIEEAAGAAWRGAARALATAARAREGGRADARARHSRTDTRACQPAPASPRSPVLPPERGGRLRRSRACRDAHVRDEEAERAEDD